MNRKFILSLAAGALLAASAPAGAQYYDPYRPAPPPYGYDRPPPPRYGYDRPPPRYGYERPQYREFSRICVTSRGDCNSRPAPIGANCRCDIPGFGLKRGNIE